jgi:transcriptional regulator with XRE-family HTH domain
MPKTIYTDEHDALVQTLRSLRSDSRLTQAELAAHLGKGQSFVSKYEGGQRRLDLIELRQIAGALGTSLTKLVAQFERTLAERGSSADQNPETTRSISPTRRSGTQRPTRKPVKAKQTTQDARVEDLAKRVKKLRRDRSRRNKSQH